MKSSQAAASNSDECPVCGGSGFELFRQRVDHYDRPLDFARPCERCRADRRMQDITGVPPQFREAELGKFGFDSYSRNMDDLRKIAYDFLKNYTTRWAAMGKGLYFWSKTPGSGKTFLSCCIGKSVAIKHDIQMRFVTAPDYLAMVGDSYKRQPGEHDKSAVYLSCDLLILDDLGAQKSGDWQAQEMFRIINERLNTGKTIIFTSNSCSEDLNLDGRTIDRVVRKSIVLQMPEEGIRGRMAKHDWAIKRLSYAELGIDKARYLELRQGCRNGLYSREMLLKACSGMPEGAAAFVVKSAVTGRSFDEIEFDRELGRIGIGRTNFYAVRRLFYGNLNRALIARGSRAEPDKTGGRSDESNV